MHGQARRHRAVGVQHRHGQGAQAQVVLFFVDGVALCAHLLQGFAVDGSKVASLKVTAQVKSGLTFPGLKEGDVPAIAISFYDEERRDLGYATPGPFVGTQDWHQEAKLIAVPRQAREGILRIGLFGATGTIDFDVDRGITLGTNMSTAMQMAVDAGGQQMSIGMTQTMNLELVEYLAGR